jgi:cytochrome c556
MKRTLLLAVALLAIPITAIAQEAPAPPAPTAPTASTPPLTHEQMVDARQSKMGRGGGTLSRLKQAADAGTDLTTLAPQIEWLIHWADELPTLFPEGTDVAGTDARPEIWSDQAGFAAAAEHFRTATRALAAPAAANDRPAFLVAIAEVRTSCSGCHASYKN